MDPIVLYYLLIHLVFLPLVLLNSIRKAKRLGAKPSFRQICLNAIFGISTMVALALITANETHILLFPRWRPSAMEIGIGVALLVIFFVARWKLLPWIIGKPQPTKHFRLPSTARQLALWCVVSVFAGVGEEIIYRGVLYDCLAWTLKSVPLAVFVCALDFAVVHAVQGWRSVLFIFVLSLSFQLFVGFAGTLYMAMVVHTLFDVAVGVQHFLKWRGTATPATAAQ